MSEITTGLDLAAAPKNTAMVSIAWAPEGAEVTAVHMGVPDDLALHYLEEPGAKVAIDAPLGWPDDFVDFVVAHREGRLRGLGLDLGSPMDSEGHPHLNHPWRRPLANRATDIHVREEVGLVPLSVSTDRIAHVAMRCARLLAYCTRDVSRDGSGDIAEVYPAASLRVWGLPARGYKGPGNLREREAALAEMLGLMPWLQLNEERRRLLIESDDAFDAFVCALTARAVSLGATRRPHSAEQEDRAQREGWIHVPTVGLKDLSLNPPMGRVGERVGA